jgi:DNA-binding GntR family transcriptional regulator
MAGEVTRALREAIVGGVYRPGDHLTEAEIASRLQVSHGPVREAFRELEAEDVVVIAPHRGAFVKVFTADDVREIYSFRSVLETAMVNLAVGHLTEEDLASLEALLDEMRSLAATRDVEGLIELDLEFHRRLCELSGHGRMYAAWVRLASPIRLLMALATPRHLLMHDAAESHAPIIRALHAGDAAAATAHMEAGVREAGEKVAAAIARSEAAHAPGEPAVP